MHTRPLPLLLLLLSLALGCASTLTSPSALNKGESTQATRPKRKIHSPKQITESVEASPVSFAVSLAERPMTDMERERNARALWPQRREEVDVSRRVVDATGAVRVEGTFMPPEIQQLFEQAEPDYQAGRYDQAERYYLRALEQAPGFYPALLEVGNCAYFSGNLERAVARFDEAIRANPHDHRGHFYKANVLTDLGRVPEALDAYAWALTLRPRYELLRQGIEAREAKLGRTLRGDAVLPDVSVQPQDDGSVKVQSAPGPHWLAFGLCKAL